MEKIELRRLGPAHRTLAIAFLTCLALAYAVALLFVFVQTEMQPSGITSQYRGASEFAEAEVEVEVPETDPSLSNSELEDAGPATLKDEWKSRSRGMKFPKSLKDMILTTHLHMLSISLILFLLGGIFSFSAFPEKAKAPVIAAGFFGLVATYACMWGLRYFSPIFSAGVFLFGLLQAISIGIQFTVSMWDLLAHLTPFPRPQDPRMLSLRPATRHGDQDV